MGAIFIPIYCHFYVGPSNKQTNVTFVHSALNGFVNKALYYYIHIVHWLEKA